MNNQVIRDLSDNSLKLDLSDKSLKLLGWSNYLKLVCRQNLLKFVQRIWSLYPNNFSISYFPICLRTQHKYKKTGRWLASQRGKT